MGNMTSAMTGKEHLGLKLSVVHFLYLCWEQQLAGQSDQRLQVGVNVFVSERACEKLKTRLFTGKPSSQPAKHAEWIPLN